MTRKNIVIGMILLLAVMVLYDAGWVQSHKAMLYYFNPDSQQRDLSRLKRNMDDFLSKDDLTNTFQHVVHKDSDALFAPALGRVDMAWVVKQDLDQISAIKPALIFTLGAKAAYTVKVWMADWSENCS